MGSNGRPLLFKGDEFVRNDITPVMRPAPK
jgi:uncharacterized protein with PIN domain